MTTDANGPMFWCYRSTFPRFIAARRSAAGLSLRRAADALSISHTHLGGLEHSHLKPPGIRIAPSVDLLRRMADLYKVPEATMLHEAGYRFEDPDGWTPPWSPAETNLRALLQSAELGLQRAECDALMDKIPSALHGMILEFLSNVDDNARAGGPSPAEILGRVQTVGLIYEPPYQKIIGPPLERLPGRA